MNVFDNALTDKALAQWAVNLLSERELECLMLLAKGLSTKQVAFKLGIGYKTTATHRFRMRQKLGLKTSTQIAVLGWRTLNFIERGLVLRQGPIRRHVKDVGKLD